MTDKIFLKTVAENLADIYSAFDAPMASINAAKIARQVLSKFNVCDEVSIVTRKLKSGASHSFVKVGEAVIDITYSVQPYSENEEEYPVTLKMRGRGRNPLDPDKKAMAANDKVGRELDIPGLLQALLTAPKYPGARHRDDDQVFIIKIKDIRSQLKKLGYACAYESIKDFLSENLKEVVVIEGSKPFAYKLETPYTLGQWMDNRVSVSDIIDELHSKYVKNTKATG